MAFKYIVIAITSIIVFAKLVKLYTCYRNDSNNDQILISEDKAIKVEMDLFADYKRIVINKAISSGLEFPHTYDDRKKIIRYVTYLRKIGGLGGHPRKVYISDTFHCPPEFKPNFDILCNLISQGKDIKGYCSNRVGAFDKTDGLFNDWGVMHLHFKESPDRTGPLLFLYLFKKEAYLINVYHHGAWEDKSILQTVYNNWPHILAPSICRRLSRPESISENEHRTRRQKGFATDIELESLSGDKITLSPFGGIVSSGDPSQDVRYLHEQSKALKHIRGTIEENADKYTQDNCDRLLVELKYKDSRWFLINSSTGEMLLGVDMSVLIHLG